MGVYFVRAVFINVEVKGRCYPIIVVLDTVCKHDTIQGNYLH